MKNTLKRIIGLLLVGVMAISLMSCGGEAPKEEKKLSKKEQSIVDAEETVKKGFELLNKCDFKGAQKYMDVEYIEDQIETDVIHMGMGTDAFMNEWMKTVSFELISSEYIDENTVEVYGKVTARDHTEALAKWNELTDAEIHKDPYKYYNNSEAIHRMNGTNFSSVIKGDTFQTITLTSTIKVIKEKNKWFIPMKSDLYNKILGDFVAAWDVVMGVKVYLPDELENLGEE